MLSPELCDALRMLKLEIPELYLDPLEWTISLAVVKVGLSPSYPSRRAFNGKKQKKMATRSAE
jgi:hypothetical protein